MQGALTVAGGTRPIVLDADGFAVPGGVRIAGSTSLRMTDYAVKPPTLMLGAIKTADQVVVTFDMELLTKTRDLYPSFWPDWSCWRGRPPARRFRWPPATTPSSTPAA